MTYEGNDTKEPVDECDPQSPQGGSRRHRSLDRSAGGDRRRARRRRDLRCRRRARKASGGPEDGDRRIVCGDAPSGATTPAGARMQRVHSGAPCAGTTQPSIGGAMLRGGTNGFVQSRNAALRRITRYDPRWASLLCGAMASPSCVSGIARASRGPSTIHAATKNAPRPLHQAMHVRRVQLLRIPACEYLTI